MLYYDDHEEVLKTLCDYASAMLKKFNKCAVQYIVYDMFELKEPPYTYAYRRVYVDAVLRVLVRDADVIKPATMAGIIDVLCKLGNECCYLVLEN